MIAEDFEAISGDEDIQAEAHETLTGMSAFGPSRTKADPQTIEKLTFNVRGEAGSMVCAGEGQDKP